MSYKLINNGKQFNGSYFKILPDHINSNKTMPYVFAVYSIFGYQTDSKSD